MHSPATLICVIFVFIVTCQFNSATGQAITFCKLFEEQDGLLVMEVESVLATDSWTLRNDVRDALGDGYYEWKYGDNDQGIDRAGTGILTYTFKITQPGSYRFLLRSSSPDNTEHNDVWVRFPGNAAIGIQQSGQGSIDIEPNSWFKVYQNTARTLRKNAREPLRCRPACMRYLYCSSKIFLIKPFPFRGFLLVGVGNYWAKVTCFMRIAHP